MIDQLITTVLIAYPYRTQMRTNGIYFRVLEVKAYFGGFKNNATYETKLNNWTTFQEQESRAR